MERRIKQSCPEFKNYRSPTVDYQKAKYGQSDLLFVEGKNEEFDKYYICGMMDGRYWATCNYTSGKAQSAKGAAEKIGKAHRGS